MESRKNTVTSIEDFASEFAAREKYLLSVFVRWYKIKNSEPENRYYYPLKQEELGYEFRMDASLVSIWDDYYGEFTQTKEYDEALDRFFRKRGK